MLDLRKDCVNLMNLLKAKGVFYLGSGGFYGEPMGLPEFCSGFVRAVSVDTSLRE